MNREEAKKIMEAATIRKEEQEKSRRFSLQFFFILSLVIGFYTGYDLLPPTDFITFIGFVFMSLVSAIGMFMLFAFIFQF